MIVSLVLGIMKIRWQWLIAVIAIGTFVDWYRAIAANDWRAKIGVDLYSTNIIEIALLVMATNIAAYLVGFGIRLIYDRLRKAKVPKT